MLNAVPLVGQSAQASKGQRRAWLRAIWLAASRAVSPSSSRGADPALADRRPHRLPRGRQEAEDEAAPDDRPRADSGAAPRTLGPQAQLPDGGADLLRSASGAREADRPWPHARAAASGTVLRRSVQGGRLRQREPGHVALADFIVPRFQPRGTRKTLTAGRSRVRGSYPQEAVRRRRRWRGLEPRCRAAAAAPSAR